MNGTYNSWEACVLGPHLVNDIKQEDHVRKVRAVENLLKSKYLTNWEVENISLISLGFFFEHLRLSKF